MTDLATLAQKRLSRTCFISFAGFGFFFFLKHTDDTACLKNKNNKIDINNITCKGDYTEKCVFVLQALNS